MRTKQAKKVKTFIELPAISIKPDYHDFVEEYIILNQYTKAHIKYKEIGTTRWGCSEYIAVLYVGKLPSKKSILSMLQKIGEKDEFDLDEDGY